MPKLSELLFGKKGGIERAPRFTDEQMQLFNQYLGNIGGAQGMGLDWLQGILSGEPGAFEAFEAPMKRQFEQEVIPTIGERFAGAGSHGATSASGLNQSLSQAGRELTQNLAQLRGGLQQSALGQLQGMLGMAYQPTFESLYRQPTMGAVPGLAGGIGQGIGQYSSLRALGGL